MKTKRYDGSEIRKILVGMVTDRTVCARVSSQWTPDGLFDAKWANIFGGLIVRHFKQFGQNPNGQVTSIFETWANDTAADDKTVESVERFIQSLQDEAVQDSSDYILDIAAKYFKRVRLQNAMELAKAEIENGKVDDAESRLSKIPKVNLGTGSFIEPASDVEAWIQAFSTDRVKPLVTYRGALGEFVGDAFQRGRLFSFMAPDKTGKTTWLMDLAYLAVRARNRVVFFDTGDGSKEEAMLRLGCRSSGLPDRDCVVRIPTDWQEGKPVLSEMEMRAIDPMVGFMKFKKICKSPDAFRISCHPNSSINVEGIDTILSDWDKEGWRADVVVIDYADILAAPRGIRDPLDQIDETWKHLKRLTQERHCCVVTATQTSSLAYHGKDEGLLSKKHFGGRKTKLAHVDGMLGINVSPAEKEMDAARINWIVRRKGRYNERHFVRVAGCLAIGAPSIISQRG